MLRRIRPTHVLDGALNTLTGPYVCDCRSIDIAETIAALVRNAPPGMVAISLRPEGGCNMIARAEREARRRGARIIWLPIGRSISDATLPTSQTARG